MMKKKSLLLIEPMVVFFVVLSPLFGTVDFLFYEKASDPLTNFNFDFSPDRNMSVDFHVDGKTKVNCVFTNTLIPQSQISTEKNCDCGYRAMNDQVKLSDISPSGGLSDYPSPGGLTKPNHDHQDGYNVEPSGCRYSLNYHRELPPPNDIIIIEMNRRCLSSFNSERCRRSHYCNHSECCTGIAESVSIFNLSLLSVSARNDSLSTIIETRFSNKVTTHKVDVDIDNEISGSGASSSTSNLDRPIHIVIPFKVISDINLRPVTAQLAYSIIPFSGGLPPPLGYPTGNPTLHLIVEWRVIEIDPVDGHYINIILENVTDTYVNNNNPQGIVDMRGQYGLLNAGKTYILDVKYTFSIDVGDFWGCGRAPGRNWYSRFDIRFE
jgi:hypothetical protein